MKNIPAYLTMMKAQSLSNSSIINAKNALEEINEFKYLDEISSTDIDSFLVSIQGKYTEGTLNVKKIYIKQYFSKQGKKEVVENIKIKRVPNNVKPEEILNVDDVNNMIVATESYMYKALISVLWETGARISEVLNISKSKDLIETPNGFEVKIYSKKTSDRTHNPFRRMLLLNSSGYVRMWRNYGNNLDDFLFPRSRVSPGVMLKKIAIKANINKPVNPHAFRHAHATNLVREGFQESIIRKKLGWTGDSKMIDKYAHINDEDVMNAQLSKVGVINNSTLPTKLIPQDSMEEILAENRKLKAQLNEVR